MKKVISLKKCKVPQEKLFCNYVHRICTQTRLDGYDYCIRHILEDKSAPFRQCSFIHPQNGKRCTNAAPKNEKRESLCPWHAKRALMSAKQMIPRKKPNESPKTLLASLELYCQDPLHDRKYDPVADQKEQMELMPVDTGSQSDLRSLGSSNDTYSQSTFIDQTWRGNADSDAESVDSEQEDPLRHAGVYTAEEVALITRDKLIRLQSLYIDQFKRLQHILKEKRRNFLHAVKTEKETLGSIQSVPRLTSEDEIQYRKLKALKRYHQHYGTDSLLQHQARERRRAATEGNNYQPPRHPKCIFAENGQKCSVRALPLSKFCLNHILKDSSQVLYKPCDSGKGDCSKPVVPYSENMTCLLHARLPGNEECSERTWKRPDPSSSANVVAESDSLIQEPEPFQSMDDIASLGLDVVQPGSLFGLNQELPFCDSVLFGSVL